MISISMLKAIVKEYTASPQLIRVPEPQLIMDEAENVEAFDAAGTGNGPITPIYLFVTSHVAQVISGCEKVLDLGCGSGRLLTQHALANPRISFTAIDLSTEMLGRADEHLRENHIQNVDLRVQDMTNLKDFTSQTFDAVISSLALHHLPDERSLEACFKEIRRVLKPNGRIFLYDYCLPKIPGTIDYLLSRTSSDQPKVLNEDALNSMKAAFPYAYFKQLIRENFPDNIETYTTALCSFMTILKSPSQKLSHDQEKHFHSIYQSLNSKNRQIYQDVAQLFKLNGLKSPIR
ncbi:MAG: class I SAM-dependent methyltransferase [Bdellovibrionaceae bacterium]|nr:class I SAM-dependent methyltransferase [Pseudobdellovibrionaceae bacterium]